MPFIDTKVNVAISKEQEAALKSRFGKAISLLPGKTESWLMLSFTDNCHMYFKGDGSKGIAFIEVKIFGTAARKDYDRLTAELTRIVSEELDISPSGVYIKYEEVENWGYNGSNF